jgi:phosphate transport system protein
MDSHLHREVERIKTKILALSAVVEDNVRRSVKALVDCDADLAAEAIALDDSKIDGTEVEIEEECLKILALHQPVASDLRFIIAVLKINNDLERVGDKAVNIARRAVYLSQACPAFVPFDLMEMATRSQSMLKRSLDALVNLDTDLARHVTGEDEAMDETNRANYNIIERRMGTHPAEIPVLMHYLAVSRQLERIADHATNIAEDVIYMVDGDIIRHQATDYQSQC